MSLAGAVLVPSSSMDLCCSGHVILAGGEKHGGGTIVGSERRLKPRSPERWSIEFLVRQPHRKYGKPGIGSKYDEQIDQCQCR